VLKYDKTSPSGRRSFTTGILRRQFRQTDISISSFRRKFSLRRTGDSDFFMFYFRFKGTWLHSVNLQDNYLSDRLRWLIWTLRYE